MSTFPLIPSRQGPKGSRILLTPLLLLLAIGASQAEDIIPSYDLRLAGNGRESYLELDEAIAAALRSNLEIQIEAISPQLEEERTLQAVGEFDPAFESRFRYDNLDTPQTSQEFVGTGGNRFATGNLLTQNRVFKEDNFEAKSGIVGKLRTGTEYDFSVRTNRFVNDLTRDPTVGRFNPEYRSFTGLTFLQPLLQDFGRDVNEAKITVSYKNKAIADHYFRQQLAGIVKDVIDAYYDAFLAYEDAMVKRFEVEVLRRMATEKREQLERGAATEQDAAAVKSRLAESYERFLLARQTLLTKNGDLLMLMQQEFEFDCYPVFLPVDAPNAHHPELDPNAIACEAMKHRPEYLMAVENVEKLGIVLKYRENQLLPRVDVEGTIGYSGLDGNYGSAFDESYDGQGHEYGLGVLISIPLGNTEKKALYAETEHQRRQALLQVKKAELETSILINRHITAVETHEKRLQAARMSTMIETDNLELTRESLEKGAVSESAVMKVERDVSETRLRQYAAAADLQKSLADLWETNGTLLSRYGIHVADATTHGPANVTSRSVSGQKSSVPVEAVPEAPPLAELIEPEDSKPDTLAEAKKEPKTLENHLQNFFQKTTRDVPASVDESDAPVLVASPVSVFRAEKVDEESTSESPLIASPLERKGLLKLFGAE